MFYLDEGHEVTGTREAEFEEAFSSGWVAALAF